MADEIEHRAIAFAETSSRLASDYDVLMCYQILLGRNPETSFVIEEAKTQPLRRIFEGFVRSAEFAAKVSRPFAQGEPLSHEGQSLGPSVEQLTWLKQALKLNRRVASAIMAARSWRALFLVLFDLPGFTTQPHPAAPPKPLGAIDRLAGGTVRGWCVDVSGSGLPVTLAMLADGDVVGQCECRLPRPDVQAVVGGDGNCGFEFEIPQSHLERAIILSAKDATSGEPVFGPLHIPPSAVVLSDRVAALQGCVGRIDQMMRHVTDELTTLAGEANSLAKEIAVPVTLASAKGPASSDRNEEVERVEAGV